MRRTATNLGPREIRKRWIEAAAAIATAVLLTQVIAASMVSGAVVLALVGMSAFCALQAQARTCAILALQGRRNLDCGVERVIDPRERMRLRAHAWRIVAHSVIVTFVAAILLGGVGFLSS